MTAESADAAYALELCARIAACTDAPGTITRTFLSPATGTVHALLRDEMETLGMRVRVDCGGNLRAVYGTEQPGAPCLLLGSHIDTVPDAGAYDGVLGVAIAIALLRRLKRERLPYALEIVAFSEEEGVRFGLPFIGSRAVTGALTTEDLGRKDITGRSVAQAVEGFGLSPDMLLRDGSDALLSPDVFGFLEIHIEQGPVLEAEEIPLGVVSRIVGQSRYEVQFEGQANHAGTTPMNLRHDALAAAAAWVFRVEQFARELEGLVATVGAIRASPGAANVIAGVCFCSLDVRHCEDSARLSAAAHLLGLAEAEATARGVRVMTRETSCQGAVAMDERLQAALLTAAQNEGVAVRRMNSGAGHDAMIMAARVPSAMLFVRSPGGVSHHPAERVLAEDVQVAVNVCVRLLQRLEPESYAGGRG